MSLIRGFSIESASLNAASPSALRNALKPSPSPPGPANRSITGIISLQNPSRKNCLDISDGWGSQIAPDVSRFIGADFGEMIKVRRNRPFRLTGFVSCSDAAFDVGSVGIICIHAVCYPLRCRNNSGHGAVMTRNNRAQANAVPVPNIPNDNIARGGRNVILKCQATRFRVWTRGFVTGRLAAVLYPRPILDPCLWAFEFPDAGRMKRCLNFLAVPL